MKIRPFCLVDMDAVIVLWQACELIRPWNNPHLDILRKLKVQSSLFVVGEQGSDIIATAMFGYDGHRGWVNYLAVLPRHQKLGYARQLMEYGRGRCCLLGAQNLIFKLGRIICKQEVFIRHWAMLRMKLCLTAKDCLKMRVVNMSKFLQR